MTCINETRCSKCNKLLTANWRSQVDNYAHLSLATTQSMNKKAKTIDIYTELCVDCAKPIEKFLVNYLK